MDKRNFYEADTLRRVKSTDPLSDTSFPDANTRNLYPQGLRDKSGSQSNLPGPPPEATPIAPPSSHRRSRSLEGLLDDVDLQNLMEQRARANRAASVEPAPLGPQPTAPPTMATPPGAAFANDDPWEQDALWRESLRRVSLRHARSLDNLDTAPRAPPAKSRPRITRGATYVNDNVAPRREAAKEAEPGAGAEDDDEEEEEDAYEVLDRAYVWDAEHQVYRKSSAANRHFLAKGNLPPAPAVAESRASTSFELDREKLRQWDLLSSACLLQEQQRTSTAESGRGLPTSGGAAGGGKREAGPSGSGAGAGPKSREEGERYGKAPGEWLLRTGEVGYRK